MAIDRIGKGPGALPPTGGAESPTATKPSAETGHAFEVAKKESTSGAAPTAAATASTPLDRLRAGEIDVPRYLDLKVEDATKHLAHLPPAELVEIRGMLRDQLATDPMLSDLVKQATGQAPTTPEE